MPVRWHGAEHRFAPLLSIKVTVMNKDKTYPSQPVNEMKATTLLHALGQSLWLDNITRDLLNHGTLKRYIDAGAKVA